MVSTSFQDEVSENVKNLAKDEVLRALTLEWIKLSNKYRYTYNFTWFGRPIIQLPQDIVAIQELVWMVKPDLIIETGIAHGGSLVLSASMLALLDLCEAIEKRESYEPRQSKRHVIGVDIEIRPDNRKAIESHPLHTYIEMIEGSSIDAQIVETVRKRAEKYERVLVCLDSNHTHQHVLCELEAYAPLVSVGSYCVVFDTLIEDMPAGSFPDRPWDKGNNPKTAVHEFLKSHPEFEIDRVIPSKLVITVAPDGYLRRVRW